MSILSTIIDAGHIKSPVSSIPSSSLGSTLNFKMPSSSLPTSSSLSALKTPTTTPRTLDFARSSALATNFSSLSTALTKPTALTTPTVHAFSPVKLNPSLGTQLPSIKPDLDLNAFRPDVHVPDLSPTHLVTVPKPQPQPNELVGLKPIVDPVAHLPTKPIDVTPSIRDLNHLLNPPKGLIDNPFDPIKPSKNLVDGFPILKPSQLDFGSIFDHLVPRDLTPRIDIGDRGTVDLGHLSPSPLKPRGSDVDVDGVPTRGTRDRTMTPELRGLLEGADDKATRRQIMAEHQARMDAELALMSSLSPTRSSSTGGSSSAIAPSRVDAAAGSEVTYQNDLAIDQIQLAKQIKEKEITARNREHEITNKSVDAINSENSYLDALSQHVEQRRQSWDYGKTTYHQPVKELPLPRPAAMEYA